MKNKISLKHAKNSLVAFIFSVFAVFNYFGCADSPSTAEPIPDTTQYTYDLYLNEEQFGFYSTTGVITTHSSYSGYVNKFIDNLGENSNIRFEVNSSLAGTAKLSIKYAFWGTTTEIRAAYIYINGELVNKDNPIYCPWTSKGGSNTWQETESITINLPEGDSFIEVSPVPSGTVCADFDKYPSSVNAADIPSPEKRVSSGKLPNIDYIHISLDTPSEPVSDPSVKIMQIKGSDSATKYFTLMTSSSENGSIANSDILKRHKNGESATLTAQADSGYKFDCWTGTHPSSEQTYTITMTEDVSIKARFVPESAVQPEGLIGYGAFADLDGKVPYTLTGGSGGETVVISATSGTTLDDFKTLVDALTGNEPRIIDVQGLVEATGLSLTITAGSNKTIMSSTGEGWIKNIEVKLNNENYIVKNMHFGEVVPAVVNGQKGAGNDALKIGGGKYIWIDHCEFSSQLSADKDYYDGLLDITNGARQITISNSYFHDHHKAILCGSGDGASDALNDVNIRITMHHNYFKDLGSRTPLIRYGKVHIFNNYWDSSESDASAVNARSGSEVCVENNVFRGIQKAVGFYFEESSGATTGKWNVSGNDYGSADSDFRPTKSTTQWKPSYDYTLDAITNLATTIPASAGIQK